MNGKVAFTIRKVKKGDCGGPATDIPSFLFICFECLPSFRCTHSKCPFFASQEDKGRQQDNLSIAKGEVSTSFMSNVCDIDSQRVHHERDILK